MSEQRVYGWKRQLRDDRDLLYKVNHSVPLPKSVDLRAKCPPVYNQGQLGSCTANAIAGAIEFDFLKQAHTDYTPSRLFIYYNERLMEGTISEDAGAALRDGIKTVNKYGVCNETLWPYNESNFTTKPSDTAYTTALTDIVTKYEKLTDIHSYKAALAAGYPFVFGFSVYGAFESQEVATTGIVPQPDLNDQFMGGHAVCAVGYDDDKQWFIVRNSWGADWGDGGYFYLPYSYFVPTLSDDFWVIYFVD